MNNLHNLVISALGGICGVSNGIAGRFDAFTTRKFRDVTLHGQALRRALRMNRMHIHLLIALITGFLLLLPPYAAAVTSPTVTIASYGVFDSAAPILVTVDSGNVIGINNLSLGFQITYGSVGFTNNLQTRQLAEDANFKLVRFDDFAPFPMPCTEFNEQTKSGTYDWTNVDNLVKLIFQIGAEPLICLGDPTNFPPGMAINPTTSLPAPESYAIYCSDWVAHFKAIGLPVKYYEIINEPWAYFGWEPVNFTKLNNYMSLFNACAASMRQKNSNILISFDFIGRRPVLDYWLANGGADVNYIDFHDYGDYIVGGKNDTEMFASAEDQYFGQWPLGYSVDQAQQVWCNARGKLLPIICSEGNFNSAWENGTDPRMQQMVGAVWTALVLRMEALNGVYDNIYFELASSAEYGKTTPSGGAGFGMINADNNTPRYPYYVNYMIGNNLAIGDQIKESNSSSEDIRSLVWVHAQTLNTLIINEVNQTRIVYLSGIEGQANVTKIDNTTSLLQNTNLSFDQPLVLNGYTVVLLQQKL